MLCGSVRVRQGKGRECEKGGGAKEEKGRERERESGEIVSDSCTLMKRKFAALFVVFNILQTQDMPNIRPTEECLAYIVGGSYVAKGGWKFVGVAACGIDFQGRGIH